MLRFCSVIGLCALAIAAPLVTASAKGTKFVVLHRFKVGKGGANPFAGLIADGAGSIYGTTVDNWGTVFRVAPDGTETTLYGFKGGTDGGFPYARLLADSSGNFYGTTNAGGSGTDCGGQLCGVAFRLAPDGTETVLHSFEGGADGAAPWADLIADGAGNLYGTTEYGGGSGNCSGNISGCGTVFRLAPDGTETVLYSFKDGRDGAEPIAGLLVDSAGNLYGTAYYGGKSDGGVIYEIRGAAVPVSHTQPVWRD